jgi:indolepyruvate ferredoxin oxidoreductase alpha subunit
MRQKGHFTFDVDKYTKAGSARCLKQHQEALGRVAQAGREADSFNLLTETGSKTAVIASSLSWDYLMEVLEKHDLDLTRLKIATAHPVPREKIRKILGSVDKVLVLEELDPIIEGAVRSESSMMKKPPVVYGKEDGVVPRVGDLSPDHVRQFLGHVLDKKIEACPGIDAEELAEPLKVQRLLTFCAGCPHRSSYYSLIKAMRELGMDPAKTVVTGDIGCTILGINEPFSVCWTEVSMGNSIGLAEGFLDAGMRKPVVATLGDGTFYHSGIPPVVNAVATGQDMPVIVLDNNWAAMTGYQETPGTVGGDEIRVPIEKIARGLGVKSVKVVNPYRTRKVVKAFKKTLAGNGVNVLVLRGPCVARQPRTWNRAVQVSDRKCPGFDSCERTCIEALACPAIVRDGDKVRIDNDVCQSCGLCANYCPKGAIKTNPFKMRRRKVGI